MATTLYIMRRDGNEDVVIHQEEVGNSSYELYLKSDDGEIYKVAAQQWERRANAETSVLRCLIEPADSPSENRGKGVVSMTAQGEDNE